MLNPDNINAKLNCAHAYRKRYLAYRAAKKPGRKIPFQEEREEDEHIATKLENEAIAKKGENERLFNGNTVRQEINRLAVELHDLEQRRARAMTDISVGSADKPSGQVWFVNKTRETVLIAVGQGATYRLRSGQEGSIWLPPGKFTYRLAWEAQGGNFGLEHTSETLLERPRTLTILDPGVPLGAASSMK